MIRLEWSSREVIRQKLQQFSADPFAPELKNHKLSGTLKGLRTISVGYDCRIVFSFLDENTALLVAIGTHGEVY